MEIADTELEALKAIFGDDYTQHIKTIKSAWKQPVLEIQHCIRLLSRDDAVKDQVYVDFYFKYVKGYPDVLPEITLDNFQGLSDNAATKLKAIVKKNAEELIGQEMIFELCNVVQDYITEHNTIVNSASAHENMRVAQRMESERALHELESERALHEELQRQKEGQLKEQVSHEIEKKQQLMKDEKVKRKRDGAQIIESKTSDFRPKFTNAIVCPVKRNSQPSIQACWFADNLGTLYSVETYTIITSSDEQYTNTKLEKLSLQLELLKKYRHSCAPIVHDFEILCMSGSVTIRILTTSYRHVSIQSILQLSKIIPVKTASSIAVSLLSVFDDLTRFRMDSGSIGLEEIWYDQQFNVVLDTLFYLPVLSELILPKRTNLHWYPPKEIADNTLHHHLWNLGSLLLQMVVPDAKLHKEPLDCLSQLLNGNPVLLSVVKILMDANLLAQTNIKELFAHPFFAGTEDVDSMPLPLEKGLEPTHMQSVDAAYFNALSRREYVSSRYHTDFQELEFLGKGGFGSVVKAKNIVDGRLYAIKRIKLNPSDGEHSKRLLREVQTLSRLHSEYIVRYYQAWFEEADAESPSTDDESEFSSYSDSSDYTESDIEDMTDDWLSSGLSLSHHRVESLRVQRRRSSGITTSPDRSPYTRILYIQMEYCEKKTLRDVIDDGLTLDLSWKYFRQLLEGLGHLHAQGIIHRDLKPSNVFLDSSQRIKIGDFGLATVKKESTGRLLQSNESLGRSTDDLTSEVGTPVYTAPEIMSGIGRYNTKVDMYSLGVLFFEMIFPMNTLMQRSVVLRNLRLPEIVFPTEFDLITLKNPAIIIKNLLNHVPRERWSCMQLLQSPLIPANVEDEYINEDLLRVVRQRNPTYFARLVSALFEQITDFHKDFAYDFASNSNTFNSLQCLISSLMELHARKVFVRHGAIQVSVPIVLPKSENVASIYQSKRPAEFLDRNGDIVELIHDLTVPFARAIAQSTDDSLALPLKRFSIDRVFRNNSAGGQPRSVEECDFDIVYEGSDTGLIAEAEVIKAIFEILEFGHTYNYINLNDFIIRVNFMQNLDFILNSAGVPSSLRNATLDILSQLHKPLGWNQAKSSLLKLGLEKGVIERLVGFDSPILVQPLSKRRIPTQLDYISPKLSLLVNNLMHLGTTNGVYFDPMLVYNHHVFSSDLVFQVARKVHSKYDVIAAGGRYEPTIHTFRGPVEAKSKKLNAVGVNIAFSKFISNMAEHQYQLRLEDTKIAHLCPKADVIVIGLGDSPIIIESKLSILNELWLNGLSAELSLITTSQELDSFVTAWKTEYSFAIILKPKGTDSFVLKVRNLQTKTEIEVQRSALLSSLTITKVKKEPSYTSIQDTDADHLKPTAIVVPLSSKKSKYKAHVGMITEKSVQAVSSVYQKSPVIAVELNTTDIEHLHPYWFVDEDTFRKNNRSINKDYALVVRRQLIKCSKNDCKLIWIYSNIDGKVTPLVL